MGTPTPPKPDRLGELIAVLREIAASLRALAPLSFEQEEDAYANWKEAIWSRGCRGFYPSEGDLAEGWASMKDSERRYWLTHPPVPTNETPAANSGAPEVKDK